jgi:hypothetical protein
MGFWLTFSREFIVLIEDCCVLLTLILERLSDITKPLLNLLNISGLSFEILVGSRNYSLPCRFMSPRLVSLG